MTKSKSVKEAVLWRKMAEEFINHQSRAERGRCWSGLRRGSGICSSIFKRAPDNPIMKRMKQRLAPHLPKGPHVYAFICDSEGDNERATLCLLLALEAEDEAKP